MAEMDPGLAHETSPWAEGPPDGEDGRVALYGPNESEHQQNRQVRIVNWHNVTCVLDMTG
jgi:hypothetical protein